jgi:hypothetical protein
MVVLVSTHLYVPIRFNNNHSIMRAVEFAGRIGTQKLFDAGSQIPK